MTRRTPWVAALSMAMMLAVSVGWFEGVRAGPASYDKETRSFRFRYTFANLPAGAMSIVGAMDVKQTPEQEATVRGLVSLVSDVMYQITEGRAKIGTVDYVDDIKDCDLIVSMTGNPSSPGWATLKGSDGQVGQIVLYYRTLETTTKQDIVFTAVHEMCHYLFGLADEYNYSNFPNGCPPRPGPGCLMDNYRPGMRGFMGKLCDGDHNSQNAQQKSCKALVDEYFAAHGVTEKDPNVKPFVPDPRPTVVAAAINQTRAEAARRVQSRRSASMGTLGSALRTFASKTLKTLIEEYNKDNPNRLVFTPEQLRKAADLIGKAGAILPLERPAGLAPSDFEKIKAQAKALGEEFKDRRTDSSRFSAIRSRLRTFVRELLKDETTSGASGVDRTEQDALIERLAREEARSAEEKKLDRLVSISNVQAELSLVSAENIIRVLDELDAPGIPKQLQILDKFRKDFQELSIPGRTSATFGLRRTRFVTPDPDDANAIVLTQAGVVSYPSLRDRGFQDFARLIDRARIELVRPNFSRAPNAPFSPINARVDRPLEAIPLAEMQAMKDRTNSDLQAFLNDILNQLERNRLENVGVLVPPGGLPPDLSAMLQVFRTKLRDKYDVRLDVAVVGAEEIPSELRGLSVTSHGSVLTITDLDEVGAIAQRLKNEQTSGSWVGFPQPSTLPQRDAPRLAGKVAFDHFRELLRNRSERIEFPANLVVDVSADDKSIDKQLQDVEKDPSLTEATHKQIDATRNAIVQLAKSLNDLDTIVFSGNDNPKGWEKIAGQKDDLNEKFFGKQANANPQEKTIAPLDQNTEASRERWYDFLKAVYNAKVQVIALKRAMGEVESASTPAASKLKPIVEDAKGTFGPELVRVDRLIRLYERLLEAAVETSKGDVPIYQRVDRVGLDKLRIAVEEREVNPATRPNGIRIDKEHRTESKIDLARFYAEKITSAQEDADLELIVGLARPLPKVWDKDQQKLVALDPPKLELYSGPGLARTLEVDPGSSSETLLVYRIPTAFPLPEGWYDPMLNVDPRILRRLAGKKDSPFAEVSEFNGRKLEISDEDDWDDINFNFSVGSNRRNVQLITSLVQPDDTPTPGTLRAAEGYATLRVQVSAGSSVLGARVRGFYQMIAEGPGPIVVKPVDFADNGEDGDLKADDGIYTARIDIHEVTRSTEYRAFVQADTTDGKARYIPLDDPNRGDQVPDPLDLAALPEARRPRDREAAARESFDRNKIETRRDTQAAEGTAIKFQRATTIHFRVTP